MSSELLTVFEMAERANVDALWLRNESKAGRVPCLKVRRGWYLYAPEAVLAELVRRASEPVATEGRQDGQG